MENKREFLHLVMKAIEDSHRKSMIVIINLKLIKTNLLKVRTNKFLKLASNKNITNSYFNYTIIELSTVIYWRRLQKYSSIDLTQ